jgi:hypothetical protein
VTPPAVGLGTLCRLSAISAADRPVLSAYLDFDPASPAACLHQFEALVETLDPKPTRADRERVRRSLGAPLALAHGTRSVGLFAAAEGSACAMVPLPVPVQAMVVVETIPWLEPVAGMLTSGDWGAAVLDRRAARLLRGGQAGLVEFAAAAPAMRRGAKPRAASSTAPQAVRELVVDRVEQVARMLARAHGRRPFERFALAAPRELWLPLERALPDGLRDRMVGALEMPQPIEDGALNAALIELLRRDQDGRRLRCARSTATALPGDRPAVFSTTSARLVHPLPHAAPCAHAVSPEGSLQAPPAAAS